MSVEFTIYNKETGVILGSGHCSEYDFLKQIRNSKQAILIGTANDVTQKVVDGEVVNKTPEEIEATKPPEPKPVPIGQQLAFITNEQWQDVLDRLDKVETR